ncbi:probable LRR receptor-like serine/threonine-protein kinase At4g29180 [Rosa chinensis]|uniref:probable LRR receptor-like serine/threonine-protein kinase At4g29180 n=1 Tax=Rosa chinensis TaxID=74649 RepID=UPI001AD9164D|nr:probable LRR receptor-like serine/threonine-protein kinase At4g29180 [Rosa chinensis]
MDGVTQTLIKPYARSHFSHVGCIYNLNSYTLEPDEGKMNNYLIRAVFMCGNYDCKDQKPVFELYLGVNPWITVKDAYVVYEIIHGPLIDIIQVCLVNNNTGVPYISASELGNMDNIIYQIGAGAAGASFALISRISLGGSNTTIGIGLSA